MAEIEALEPLIQGWRVRFTRLAFGPCPASLQERAFPSLHLVRLQAHASVAVSSQPLGGVDPFQVGVLSPEPGRLVWDGTSVLPNRILVKDGSDGSNFVLPAGCELVVVRFDRDRLATLARALSGDGDPPRRIEQHPISSPELGELRLRLHALFALDPAQQPHLIEVLEQDLYERIALTLANAPDPPGLSLGDRRRVLKAAEAYAREHARERITLADLCLVARCSERTLRYAFHAHYGLSPACFVKRIRLQGLRRDLLGAPSRAKVIDLALRWGFWHLGHLSRDYRRLFDETPVDTLHREYDGGPPIDLTSFVRSPRGHQRA